MKKAIYTERFFKNTFLSVPSFYRRNKRINLILFFLLLGIVSIAQVPSVNNLSLDASSPQNRTVDDLSSTYNTTGPIVETAVAWHRNGTPECVIYLPFEGGSSSSLADFSGNGNHAATTGESSETPFWDPTGGPNGSGAYIFDGNDFLLAGDIFPLNSSYTKTVWISASGGDYRNIISSQYNGVRDHHFKVNPDGILNAGHSFGAEIVEDPIALIADQWYFVAVTFDYATGDMVLYKDGIEVDRNIVHDTLRSIVDETVLIGARDGIWGWNGGMDEPKIFHRALSAEQISSLYTNGNDMLESEETRGSDQWFVDVTAFSTSQVGSTVRSNTLTIRAQPLADYPWMLLLPRTALLTF